MALILARSPFFVSNEGLDRDATLTVEIQKITDDEGNTEISNSYSLTFSRQTQIDISNLLLPDLQNSFRPIRVKTTVEGVISEVTQTPTINYYVASKGYAYHEEGYNYDASNYLLENSYYAGSTDCIYHLDDTSINIPLLSPDTDGDSLSDVTIYISLMNKGELVRTTVTTLTAENNEFGVSFSTNPFGVSYINFEDRIRLSGGEFEDNKCNERFFDKYSAEAIDNIRITNSVNDNIKDVKVVAIQECKYDPYKIQFVNKFGIEEDLWFFKRSDKTLNTTRETYRKNVGLSSTSDHVYSSFNVMGKESMVLNSGYVPEEFYEAFKQLFLSEQVWIYSAKEPDFRKPVNIKNNSLEQGLHVNDKLINYEIEIEYSFDTIRNIV